jgi:hypothetical protein
MLCISIFSKLPKNYLENLVSKYEDVVLDKNKFNLYVDKFLFKAMNTCLKISKDADPSKLQSDIMILFERDTWRSNVDRYYEFD